MKLINKTKWNTSDLKKLCSLILKKYGSHKNHIVTIRTRNSAYNKNAIGGHANVNGRHITITVPKTEIVTRTPIYSQTETTVGSDGNSHPAIIGWNKNPTQTKFNSVDFAQTLEHELGHNFGLRKHRDMRHYSILDCDYAKDFIVRPTENKPKIKRSLVNERQKKAETKVKEMTSKLKRYQNLLKKWQTKVKYYQKRGVK